MVPYKKIDLIVQAFAQMPDKRLVVIGDGPDFAKIQKSAESNVILMGYQPFDVLKDHMQRAKAFVFAAEEDFGIVPVERKRAGRPWLRSARVECWRRSRVWIQTLRQVYFTSRKKSLHSLARLNGFEEHRERFKPAEIRSHALTFNQEHFKENLERFVAARYEAWRR